MQISCVKRLMPFSRNSIESEIIMEFWTREKKICLPVASLRIRILSASFRSDEYCQNAHINTTLCEKAFERLRKGRKRKLNFVTCRDKGFLQATQKKCSATQ